MPSQAPPRRRPGRLSARLLAFNLLLVFIPAAGLLYLDTYEKQLLEAQERSMVQQGRVLAAALSEPGALAGEEAPRVLMRLNRRLESRIRVVDREGKILGDTSRLGPAWRQPRPSRARRAPATGFSIASGRSSFRSITGSFPRPSLRPKRGSRRPRTGGCTAAKSMPRSRGDTERRCGRRRRVSAP